jgi:CheY-like chemotaxis protein
MDGYTAAAEIRHRLGLAELPIVAMTANAMAADREACLAAGMNDHVGKPFDLDQLVETILRHSRREPDAPDETVPAALGPASDSPPLLLPALFASAAANGIELDRALHRLGGNVGVYLGMLRRFMADLPAMARQALAQFDSGERRDAGLTMHTLKGLAATLGIARLATAASAAEAWLTDKTGQADDPLRDRLALVAIADSVAGLQVAIASVVTGLDQALAAAVTGPAPPGPDRAELQQTLVELARLLADSDLTAIDVHARLPKADPALAGDRLQALADAISALDFEPALAQCRALLNDLSPGMN